MVPEVRRIGDDGAEGPVRRIQDEVAEVDTAQVVARQAVLSGLRQRRAVHFGPQQRHALAEPRLENLGRSEEGTGPHGRIEQVVRLPLKDVGHHRFRHPVRRPELAFSPEGFSGRP